MYSSSSSSSITKYKLLSVMGLSLQMVPPYLVPVITQFYDMNLCKNGNNKYVSDKKKN